MQKALIPRDRETICSHTFQEWDDFAQTAAMEGTDVKPYVLVSSYSPQNTDSRTNNLASPIKTELGSATSNEIRILFRNLVDPEDNQHLSLSLFLLLDKQSPNDRKVVIVHRQQEWVHTDGTTLPCDPKEVGSDILGRDDLDQFVPKVAWRRYRVPFEEAAFHWLVLEEKGPNQLEEDERYRQFLENVDIAPVEEKAPA